MSQIEWTGETLNTWTGCTRKSAGCAHCYIDRQPPLRIARRKFVDGPEGRGRTLPHVDGVPVLDAPTLVFHMERLGPMIRRRVPTLYFVNSMSDTFHEDVSDDLLVDLWVAFWSAPQHTFQVLTKRPERMAKLLASGWFQNELIERMPADRIKGVSGYPLENVWLGTTVENRAQVGRADWLRKTPAEVRFLSCEPLLGPVVNVPVKSYLCECGQGDPAEHECCTRCGDDVPGCSCNLDLTGIDWVIAGGESGPGARRCAEQWLRDLRDACLKRPMGGPPFVTELEEMPRPRKRPAFFLKQLGGHPDKRGGDKALLDGQMWHEMPGGVRGPQAPAQGVLA